MTKQWTEKNSIDGIQVEMNGPLLKYARNEANNLILMVSTLTVLFCALSSFQGQYFFSLVVFLTVVYSLAKYYTNPSGHESIAFKKDRVVINFYKRKNSLEIEYASIESIGFWEDLSLGVSEIEVFSNGEILHFYLDKETKDIFIKLASSNNIIISAY